MVVSLIGLVLLVFVLGAFLAPPFSGLDTLPALGVVVVCLGLVFSDGFIVGAGLVIGVVGLVLEGRAGGGAVVVSLTRPVRRRRDGHATTRTAVISRACSTAWGSPRKPVTSVPSASTTRPTPNGAEMAATNAPSTAA